MHASHTEAIKTKINVKNEEIGVIVTINDNYIKNKRMKILKNKDNEPYLIAEIGINHNGDLSIARKLMDAVHACGWDTHLTCYVQGVSSSIPVLTKDTVVSIQPSRFFAFSTTP